MGPHVTDLDRISVGTDRWPFDYLLIVFQTARPGSTWSPVPRPFGVFSVY
jgi:hypothetical protein